MDFRSLSHCIVEHQELWPSIVWVYKASLHRWFRTWVTYSTFITWSIKSSITCVDDETSSSKMSVGSLNDWKRERSSYGSTDIRVIYWSGSSRKRISKISHGSITSSRPSDECYQPILSFWSMVPTCCNTSTNNALMRSHQLDHTCMNNSSISWWTSVTAFVKLSTWCMWDGSISCQNML